MYNLFFICFIFALVRASILLSVAADLGRIIFFRRRLGLVAPADFGRRLPAVAAAAVALRFCIPLFVLLHVLFLNRLIEVHVDAHVPVLHVAGVLGGGGPLFVLCNLSFNSCWRQTFFCLFKLASPIVSLLLNRASASFSSLLKMSQVEHLEQTREAD